MTINYEFSKTPAWIPSFGDIKSSWVSEKQQANKWIDDVDLKHVLDDTPAKLIWDVRLREFSGNVVTSLFKKYCRNPFSEESGRYYGDGTPFKVNMGVDLEHWGYVAKLEQVQEIEMAFMGFCVDHGSSMVTHDLPRCDMKFTAGRLKDQGTQSMLMKIKVYLEQANLYLYKTANSFHLYGDKLILPSDVPNWIGFLKGLNDEFPGLIDSKWIYSNIEGQPLRINRTKARGYPYIYCIL